MLPEMGVFGMDTFDALIDLLSKLATIGSFINDKFGGNTKKKK